MNNAGAPLNFLRELTWNHIFFFVLILFLCSALSLLTHRIVDLAAKGASPRQRLMILRAAPLVRLVIWVAGITAIVPIVVEPNFEDVAALLATVGLTLAFAFKDYVSCLVAGIVTIVENTYQLGDWIEVDGLYGEVRTISIRAVHIVTADDTEVVIPHAKLWATNVLNASAGKPNLMVVANFYLCADHDAAAVRDALAEVAETSPHRKQETPVIVTVAELPWGTRYKLKAYVRGKPEQFAMTTDLTIRGKERLRGLNVVFAQTAYAEGQAR